MVIVLPDVGQHYYFFLICDSSVRKKMPTKKVQRNPLHLIY